MKRHQERSSNERGQTLVEFAALLPVLCLLLFGIIQFGVVFHDYLTVTDASRVGARKAAVSRLGGDTGAAAVAAASDAANGLNWYHRCWRHLRRRRLGHGRQRRQLHRQLPLFHRRSRNGRRRRHPDERHDRTLGVIMRREHGQAAALTVLFMTVLLAVRSCGDRRRLLVPRGSRHTAGCRRCRTRRRAGPAGEPEHRTGACARVRWKERRRGARVRRHLLDHGSPRRHGQRPRQ